MFAKESQSLGMNENEITNHVINRAIKIHKALGPGLLESAYQKCLAYELENSGLKVEIEKPLPLIYESILIDCGYKVDLFIENKVILEIKAVEKLNEVHLAQILTYLKLTDCKVGLLINFNVSWLKNGLKRVVNQF